MHQAPLANKQYCDNSAACVVIKLLSQASRSRHGRTRYPQSKSFQQAPAKYRCQRCARRARGHTYFHKATAATAVNMRINASITRTPAARSRGFGRIGWQDTGRAGLAVACSDKNFISSGNLINCRISQSGRGCQPAPGW